MQIRYLALALFFGGVVTVASLSSPVFGERKSKTTASVDRPKQLELMLTPNADGKTFRIVAPQTDKPPKGATLIRCDSMEFTSEGAIFHQATLRSLGQEATCDQATLNAAEASIKFSKDVRVKLNSPETRKQFLDALQQR